MKPDQAADIKGAVTRETPANRLGAAVDRLWVSHGRAQMSARLTAGMAGETTSLINYYFVSFERLLTDSLSRNFERCRRWQQQRLEALRDVPAMGAEAAGHVLACLIDDLCVSERPFVFAWFECQIMAARDAAYYDIAAAWQTAWQAFWQDVAVRLGLTDAGDLLYQFADSELSFHRIAWRNPFDRACLSETCLGWMRLMETGHGGHMPIRDHLRSQAGPVTGLAYAEGTLGFDIAQAGAQLVAQKGAGAVTHRAVAAAAGVNLGVVTYHFATANDLMHAAYEAIYAQMIRSDTASEPAPALDAEAFAEVQAAYMTHARGQDNLLALDELIGAAARDPALGIFGGALRYTRGRTSFQALAALSARREPLTRSEAALFSSWSLGLGRHARFMPVEQRQGLLQQFSLRMLAYLTV